MLLLCFHYIFIQPLYQNYYVRKQTTQYSHRTRTVHGTSRAYSSCLPAPILPLSPELGKFIFIRQDVLLSLRA